ncbi:cytochrome d ubiquinol oxidase subunit II [Alginatibacterium sediminis]|uniref:Cytochrome d ubiquinol oxidase subunit II n=1 Tax=Alginatibacterium sediminis TaxID=2164068 RepID=A0A420E678_9ALTE|nr:cytochrome d ubiquinol oxidase subunit II [Alginatibacterium sediminis]RKF13294.1 cytochrome d ubiquinol oxidase subunit II [Alginatibacterium sediminis]
MIDYETIRLIWWVLLGVILVGFAVTDGFDLGVGALLTLVGRNDTERRVMINTIGPHWEGNQVWFVTAGAGIFAAWPTVYASAFSGFYVAFMLTLVALWMRPLGFDYRSKLKSPRWRASWDWALFVGGLVPALIFGVAFGNLLLGVPFELDSTLKSTYSGSFWGLLRPFALLAGLLSVAMLLMHGAAWLQMKTTGELRQRAEKVAMALAIASVVLFTAGGLWVSVLDGYVISSVMDHHAPSNPLLKDVVVQSGAWLNNYQQYPLMMIAPLLGLLAPVGVFWASKASRCGWAFVCSALSLAGVIFTAGLSMFPFLLPSNITPSMSLTMWDATSSQMTLSIMFYVALVFVPIILAYTLWSFWVMRGRLKAADIEAKSASMY